MPAAADDPVVPRPVLPDSWDDVFALLHDVWSDAASGRPYARQAWNMLHVGLTERAAAAGWRPRLIREMSGNSGAVCLK